MKALLSVYDKTGIVDFGSGLAKAGYSLVSTGGTFRELDSKGVNVTQVSDLTGSPEILEGRVKTLHPTIHGGILARRDVPSHISQLQQNGIDEIDVVVVNLYPFVDTVSKPDVELSEALENIDIGGPTMIRSAAKNFRDVIVVVDPSDYEWIGNSIASGNGLTELERKALAQKAFQHVAHYDTAISNWLRGRSVLSEKVVTTGYEKLSDLRYGENPHQKAAVYKGVLSDGGVVESKQLHGLPMSYTNFLDADAAWTTVSDFESQACVVVKHTNPCGISVNEDQVSAYRNAFSGDTVSAYGGIVGFNREVSTDTANAMKGVLFDIIIAPSFSKEALKVFTRRKRTRILQATPAKGPINDVMFKTVSGGVLIQTLDRGSEDQSSWKVVSKRPPSDSEWEDMAFAWQCVRHIKSNTIVLAKDGTLVGMGAGQPNRVVSIHLALRIAEDKSKGSALASDAFMPFADNIEMAASGGITSVIQPGGSIRDSEVIKAADKYGISVVFTGTRHFNH